MERAVYLFPLRLHWDADSASLTKFLTHVTDAALVAVTTQVVGGQAWVLSNLGPTEQASLSWSMLDEFGAELAGGAQSMTVRGIVRTPFASQPTVTAKRLTVRIRFDTPPEFPLAAVPANMEVLWTGHFATHAVT